MVIAFTCDGIIEGGAEKVICLLSNKLSEIGHKIYVIGLSVPLSDPYYKLNKNVKYLSVQDGKNKLRFFKRIRRLRGLLLKLGVEVAVSFLPHNSIYTHYAVKKTNIIHIVSERNNPYTDPKNIIIRLLKKISFYRADGCVFQSKGAMYYYPKKIYDKSIIIQNPVMLKSNPFFGIKREEMIITACRLVKQKNLYLLIDSFAIFLQDYPSYKLVVYGDGPMKNELQHHIKAIGLDDKIMLYGSVKNSEWHSLCNHFSMFILSSDYEGMPNSLLEAMCLGIPCISTDCPPGGPRDIIINNYNGILTKTHDKESMVAAMKKIASDPEFSSFLSKNNSKLYSQLSIMSITNKWILFLERIKGSKNGEN